MRDRKPQGQGHDWHGAVSDAMEDMAETENEVAEVRARRRRSKAATYTLLALPVLGAVLAWNVWSFTRTPQLPPDPEIAFALRKTAGALAEEVLALKARQGRLPTAGELGGYVDDELTYTVRGEGFVITNTDGVIAVRYDGAQPVADWVAGGGFTRVEVTP